MAQEMDGWTDKWTVQQLRRWKENEWKEKDRWKYGQTSKTAQGTLVPTPLSPAPVLVSSSPQEGTWLSCPHFWVGLGGEKG